MSEMVERVANALASMHYQRHPPEQFFQEAALAAIEAMQPTDNMVQKAIDQFESKRQQCWCPECVRSGMRAALSAALSPL